MTVGGFKSYNIYILSLCWLYFSVFWRSWLIFFLCFFLFFGVVPFLNPLYFISVEYKAPFPYFYYFNTFSDANTFNNVAHFLVIFFLCVLWFFCFCWFWCFMWQLLCYFCGFYVMIFFHLFNSFYGFCRIFSIWSDFSLVWLECFSVISPFESIYYFSVLCQEDFSDFLLLMVLLVFLLPLMLMIFLMSLIYFLWLVFCFMPSMCSLLSMFFVFFVGSSLSVFSAFSYVWFLCVHLFPFVLLDLAFIYFIFFNVLWWGYFPTLFALLLF